MGRAVGVDIGGTKTQVRVMGPDGLLANEVLPTRQWWVPGGPVESPDWAEGLIREVCAVLQSAGGPPQVRDALVIGSHGVDYAHVATRASAEVSLRFPGRVRVLNDAGLVGPAAGRLGSVITVISGTGSIVWSLDADGRVRQFGGHGYLLGDEGSAPALVRDLTRAALRAADRGVPDHRAVAELRRAAGLSESVADPEAELAAELHHHAAIADWGRLAPAVFAAAEGGSVLAGDVIARHAADLADLVGLHFAAGVNPEAVVLAGGVVTSQPSFARLIRDRIHALRPDVPVQVLADPPVAGAVRLAEQLLESPPPPVSPTEPPVESVSPIAQEAAHTEGSKQ